MAKQLDSYAKMLKAMYGSHTPVDVVKAGVQCAQMCRDVQEQKVTTTKPLERMQAVNLEIIGILANDKRTADTITPFRNSFEEIRKKMEMMETHRATLWQKLQSDKTAINDTLSSLNEKQPTPEVINNAKQKVQPIITAQPQLLEVTKNLKQSESEALTAAQTLASRARIAATPYSMPVPAMTLDEKHTL